MKLTRFRFLPALLLLLAAFAVARADTAPVEYRIEPGSKGSYAVITGAATPTDLVIPSQVEGIPVREIGRGAFAGCTTLKTLTVEQGVRTVGMNAFGGERPIKRSTINATAPPPATLQAVPTPSRTM